jgi:multidrug efflux pump subunit AcrA (membrane-fusion protein)
MNETKLTQLHIEPEQKRRPARSLWLIFFGVLAVVLGAGYFAWPRLSDGQRVLKGKGEESVKLAGSAEKGASPATGRPDQPKNVALSRTNASAAAPTPNDDVATTESGYIVNRARIELSPRFLGVVKWIGVRKGDTVTNGQVVVLLDDAEYKARLAETEGQLAVANVGVARAELDLRRARDLVEKQVEMRKVLDDAELQVQSARAQVKQIQGAMQLVRTYIDWCTIRSPINGIVMEKLVDPDELVVPQSFGGGRGPSTALISVADPKDLQVEIDLNEATRQSRGLSRKSFRRLRGRGCPGSQPREGHVAGESSDHEP